MRQFSRAICIFTAIAGIGSGQTFEVATVKVNQSGRRPGEQDVVTAPGSLTMRNAGIMQAIVWAYKVSPLQVTGLTREDGDRYEIVAKASGPAKVDEMRIMLQNLLAERFKLKVHRENKEMSAIALLEAKGGHKLKESDADDGPGVVPMTEKMGLSGRKTTLDQLAMFLSMPLRTPVIDMTGLKGKYDFDFDISAFVPMDKDRVAGEPPPDPVTIIGTLLPKQLGLRIESRKMPVPILVVDHFEKVPAEN